MKMQKNLKTKLYFYITTAVFGHQIITAQSNTIRKVSIETGKIVVKKASQLSSKRSVSELIIHYSKISIKNGLGKSTRIENKSIKNFLEETFHLRGKDELVRIGNKITTFKNGNLNNIKGFLAEEIHHNELLKLDGVQNIKRGVKEKTSKHVRKKQLVFLIKSGGNNKTLHVHKIIEIDLLAQINDNKILLEVKNIDKPFSDVAFKKLLNQLVKQKAYADEKRIGKVYLSNIGIAKLSPEQIKSANKHGITVLQHGSTSPMINAKINMNCIKRDIAL